MRNLKRNQNKIYCSLYLPYCSTSAELDKALLDYMTLNSDGSFGTTDKWGNPIGGYSEPIELHISLSADGSDTENEVFGKNLTYDRQMVTTDMKCPVDEFSRLWIGIPITESHNYEVVRVATTMRQKRYAIKRVLVDED